MTVQNICLIQARLESTRLPGKVLLPLYKDKCSIDLLSERLSRSKQITKLIFILPESKTSDVLYEYITSLGCSVERGSEQDLVMRHLKAVSSFQECNIIRITSDCPLVDPAWVDKCISLYITNNVDYCSTYTPANESLFCNGSDIEVFSKSTLEYMYDNFSLRKDREHVTFPLWDGRMKHIKHLKMSQFLDHDLSSARLTLDYREDLQVIRSLLSYTNDIHAPLEKLVKCYHELSCELINGGFDYAAGWK